MDIKVSFEIKLGPKENNLLKRILDPNFELKEILPEKAVTKITNNFNAAIRRGEISVNNIGGQILITVEDKKTLNNPRRCHNSNQSCLKERIRAVTSKQHFIRQVRKRRSSSIKQNVRWLFDCDLYKLIRGILNRKSSKNLKLQKIITRVLKAKYKV